MNDSRHPTSLILAAGLALGVLSPLATADKLYFASPTTLIAEGNPFDGGFNVIGACGGAAWSATLQGSTLLIGDPNHHIYRKSPGDPFVGYAFDVPNDAKALVMHAGNLLSGGDNSVVRVDAQTGAVLATFNLSVPVTALAIHGDDLYVGSSFGIVQKGSALTGGFQFWGTCGGPVTSMAIDGSHLFLGSGSAPGNQGSVYCLDLGSQQITATYAVANDLQALVLHQGDLLAAGSGAQVARVARLTGQLKGTFQAGVAVSALAVFEETEIGNPYCYGVGCPCGNDDPQAGCANSMGFGAHLAGFGSASVSADDLKIHAFQLPRNKNGRFYMAPTLVQIPFGGGFLCAGSGGYGMFRLPPANSGSAGAISTPDGLVAWTQANLPAAGHILPGSTWHFQAWYRDSQGPCSTFNTTDALSVSFLP